MSKTDNTAPWRLRAHILGEHEESIRRFYFGGHKSHVKHWARRFTRRGRHDARRALRRGEQPEPYRPRSSAHWEAW